MIPEVFCSKFLKFYYRNIEGARMKYPLLGASTLVAIMIAAQALVPLKAMAAEDGSSGLAELKKENAQLREELAALRERDRLKSEISTVRARVERPVPATPAAAVPTSVRGAYAADKPVYKAVPYVQPAAATSWNGFYAGLNVGAREDQVGATTVSERQFVAGLPPFPPTLFAGPNASVSQSAWSFRVGPYVGYNWQLGSQWLVGIEGDWAWADRKTTFVGSAYPGTVVFAGIGSPDTFTVRTQWDAAIRARVGLLATPNLLLYLAGGPAWMNVETTSACVAGGPNRPCFGISPPFLTGLNVTQSVFTNNSTKPGWTLGGGAEAMFAPGWIVRAEYRYSDYGTISHTDTRLLLPGAALIFGADGFNETYGVHVRTNLATLGIAHKF
jgi:outer membrane immunogenic protein